MSFEVEMDVPVQNANGVAAETFGFSATGEVSRSLKTGSLIAESQDGDVHHKITFVYERTEQNVDLGDVDAPALVPSKAYRVTIEEVTA